MWKQVSSLLWRAPVPGLSPAVTVRSTSHGPSCSVSGREWVRPSGFDTGLKTFNSLSKQKEPLILTREGVATWYGL